MLRSAATAIRTAARPAAQVAREIPRSEWAALRGEGLLRQLKLNAGTNLSADRLRTTVANLRMLNVKMDDPGLVKWLGQVVPGAVKRASIDDKVGFFSQARASGVPLQALNQWMPEGWGTVGGVKAPLVKNAADLDAFAKRMGTHFPSSKIIAAPELTSIIAVPTKGAPVRLTFEGQSMSMARGAKSAQVAVPFGATSRQLDRLVTDLGARLGG